MGAKSRRLLNQSTYSRVAYSTASKDRHGPRRMDDLGLLKAIDRLAQGAVAAVANAPYRRLDPSFGKALGIFHRDILAAAVALLEQAITMERPAIMNAFRPTLTTQRRKRSPTPTACSALAHGTGV